jgi:tetratricopeptide (TPR) repeat protein
VGSPAAPRPGSNRPHLASHPGQQHASGDDAAWLLDRAASYLRVHARLEQARPLAERALAITETAHGPDHPDVGARLNNLALILRDLGEPAQARPLAERALAITETAHGPDHPNVGIDLNNLALILRDLGETEQARSLEERASAVRRPALCAVRKTGSLLAAVFWRTLADPGGQEPFRAVFHRRPLLSHWFRLGLRTCTLRSPTGLGASSWLLPTDDGFRGLHGGLRAALSRSRGR